MEASNLDTILANMTTTRNSSEKSMMMMLHKIMINMNSLEQTVNGNPGRKSSHTILKRTRKWAQHGTSTVVRMVVVIIEDVHVQNRHQDTKITQHSKIE